MVTRARSGSAYRTDTKGTGRIAAALPSRWHDAEAAPAAAVNQVPANR